MNGLRRAIWDGSLAAACGHVLNAHAHTRRDAHITGDITKVNLYYDTVEGCVRGVKPTYGSNATDARRVGTEATAAGTAHATADIKLASGEFIVKGEYKYTSRCEH